MNASKKTTNFVIYIIMLLFVYSIMEDTKVYIDSFLRGFLF